jgi:hypothetical protein
VVGWVAKRGVGGETRDLLRFEERRGTEGGCRCSESEDQGGEEGEWVENGGLMVGSVESGCCWGLGLGVVGRLAWLVETVEDL